MPVGFYETKDGKIRVTGCASGETEYESYSSMPPELQSLYKRQVEAEIQAEKKHYEL